MTSDRQALEGAWSAEFSTWQAYRELYEIEVALRKAAEADRDYWKEEANYFSELADKYIARDQEDPF